MIKSTIKKLQDRVNTTRKTVADIAESVGAPEKVTAMIRPTDKPDPWANPRSVQSADDPAPAEPAQPAERTQPPAPKPAATAADDAAPREHTAEEAQRAEQVQELLDDMINPAIASHGGYIRLLGIEDDRVMVEMGGGCQGCGAASLTLKAGVERMLKEELAWLAEVVDSTDHSAGTNPYYAMEK